MFERGKFICVLNLVIFFTLFLTIFNTDIHLKTMTNVKEHFFFYVLPHPLLYIFFFRGKKLFRQKNSLLFFRPSSYFLLERIALFDERVFQDSIMLGIVILCDGQKGNASDKMTKLSDLNHGWVSTMYKGATHS